jgi:hypothetical protein
MGMIGKLSRVPLRQVWPHEAYDFTRWLTENPDVLSEALGITLNNVEYEQAAGNFSVDIRAEDQDGNAVVIENQLEKSNHDHLGKLITYLASFEAKTAVWIVADARPEHTEAINWLNQTGAAAFYLVKVEGVKIGSSEPAPLLTLITGPSQEFLEIGASKKEMSERHELRYQFWSQLLEKQKEKTNLFSRISPSKHNWIGTGSGISGVVYNYVIWQDKAAVEIYIDRGEDGENQRIFYSLAANRENIEKSYGAQLDWQPLEGRRACRIRAPEIVDGGLKTAEKWPQLQEKMIDQMTRIEKAFKPYISDLKS